MMAPAFDDWWRNDGQYIDPDTSDVPWFDKRRGLAEYAFAAGARFVAPAAALPFQDMEFLKESGEVGDCVRAATASILGVDRSEVPHFVKDASGDWKHPWRDFLEARGYEVIEVDPRLRPDCDYLACGPTERSIGDGTASHMVVMNWTGLLHDPHPSRKGLTGIDRVYVLALKAARAALQSQPAPSGETK